MPHSGDQSLPPPHVALFPSAGMGHLTPFFRLASLLLSHGCDVSFVAVDPTVSAAESRHVASLLSTLPAVRLLHLHVSPLPGPGDPFFLHFEAIRRSAHLLPPLLASSSSPISAVFIDISLVSAFLPLTSAAGFPSYVLFSASAAMLSLLAFFPTLTSATIVDLEIPGLGLIPKRWIPQLLHDRSQLFTKQFAENAEALTKAAGILVNTFEALERESLAALNSGKVVPRLPPIIPVGPFPSINLKSTSSLHPWLDAQPAKSVIFVSFGSRTAMSAEQIRELGSGLEKSGHRFLWVVKTKKVDREEEAGNLEELLGADFLERVKWKAMVVSGWVEQEKMLEHAAIGGFLSHCGWNSVVEAAERGVAVLAWPRHGDQRMNAGVVRRSGLGIWKDEWSWEGEERVVRAEKIAEAVRELMEKADQAAVRLRMEAAKAIGDGGSSKEKLKEVVAELQRQQP